jgi:hypothetical protein
VLNELVNRLDMSTELCTSRSYMPRERDRLCTSISYVPRERDGL